MAILHVRNVPEELYERLQQRARVERRSLSAEVISLLERALQEPMRPRADVLDAIFQRRTLPPNSSALPDSTTLLREDRAR